MGSVQGRVCEAATAPATITGNVKGDNVPVGVFFLISYPVFILTSFRSFLFDGLGSTSIRDLREYATTLLDSSIPRRNINVDDDEELRTPRLLSEFEKDREREEGMSCREAVEVMTRISKKGLFPSSFPFSFASEVK